jgi:hypothetical protein
VGTADTSAALRRGKKKDKQRQQRLWLVSASNPTLRKYAKDGAPVGLWLVEENGQPRGQQQIFSAALLTMKPWAASVGMTPFFGVG